MRKPGQCCAPTRMAAPTPCVTCPPSCLRSPTQTLRSASRLCTVLAPSWVGRGERIDEIVPLVEHGLRGGRLLDERGAASWPVPQLLGAFIMLDRNDRALELIDEVAEMARRDGSAFGALVAIAYRAWCHVRLGDLAVAESEMQTVADVAHPNDLQLDVATIYWFLCDAIGERTGLDALAGAVEALEPPGEFARTMAGAMMREARGRYRCALVARWSRSARRCGAAPP